MDGIDVAYNLEHPENMPEVIREITMIRGALDGLDRRWDELVAKVGPIRLQRPELVSGTSPDKGEIGPVFSDLGKQLREIYDTISYKETRIANLTGELGL